MINTDKVEKVMKSVDRGDFCKSNPYYDAPQGIGYGVTISAPHMVIEFVSQLHLSSYPNYFACSMPMLWSY